MHCLSSWSLAEVTVVPGPEYFPFPSTHVVARPARVAECQQRSGRTSVSRAPSHCPWRGRPHSDPLQFTREKPTQTGQRSAGLTFPGMQPPGGF